MIVPWMLRMQRMCVSLTLYREAMAEALNYASTNVLLLARDSTFQGSRSKWFSMLQTKFTTQNKLTAFCDITEILDTKIPLASD